MSNDQFFIGMAGHSVQVKKEYKLKKCFGGQSLNRMTNDRKLNWIKRVAQSNLKIILTLTTFEKWSLLGLVMIILKGILFIFATRYAYHVSNKASERSNK